MKNFCAKLCCLSSSSSSIKLCGMAPNRSVKFIYIVLIVALYVATIFINKIIIQEGQFQQYDCIGKQHQMKCVNQEVQFRNMISLSILFFVLGICMFFKPDTAKIINEGMWIIKIIILMVLMTILLLLIPQSIINVAYIMSSIWAFFYYFVQNLVIIDCSFKFDEYLTQLISQSNNAKRYLALKLIATAYICLCSLFLNFLSYFELPLYYSIGNSVMMGILLILVLLRVFPNNSLLIWGMITLLANMLTFLSYPIQRINEFNILSVQILIQLGLALFFFIGMLTSGSKRIRTKSLIINELFVLTTTSDDQDARYISSNKWKIYHIVMAICVFTLPAVLHLKYHSGFSQQSEILEYSRIWAVISVYLIYIWSLIASRLYKADDFSQLQNYFRQFELN